jgi:hypothetical protein
MAATPISSIITQVRRQLIETKKGRRFWDDDELKDIFKLGVMDLWGAILDLHQDHYFKVIEGDDARPVILEAGKSVLTNVPEDCFRVMLIEPNDTTVTDTTGGVVFAPRKYNHPDFITARTLGSLDSAVTAGIIYYDVTGPGAPIAAPVIRVAPKIGSNLTLRFAYYPMLEVDDINPVPGGSDNALKAWTIAYALAKEGPQGARTPDASWLAVYATEKQTILTRSTPRQEQEADTVDGLFDNFYI